MKKAAVYARFSSHNQKEKSIDDQVSEARAYAAGAGLQIVAVYADRAMTGKNDARPDFQKMLKDAEKKLFDVVIIWKRDRFARNRYDAAINKRRLEKCGVSILYLAEPNIEGPESIIVDATLEGFAEYYSQNLAVNVCRGMKKDAEKAKYLGSNIPFGFKVDAEKNFIIDETAAPFVVEAFKMYARGVRLAEISDYLDGCGFRNPKGNKFSIRNLSVMFENKKYIGVYEYRLKGQPPIVVENAFPAIIDGELWAACQRKKEVYKKAPHQCDDYALSGLMFCGCCGVGFNGANVNVRGVRYNYYRHDTNGGVNCLHRNFQRAALEKAVFDLIFEKFLSDENISRISALAAKKESNKKSPEKALKAKLAETDTGIKNIMAAIEAGILTPTTKARLNELENQKAALEIEISKAAYADADENKKADVAAFMRGVRAGVIDDAIWRKETAALLIDKIDLFADCVKVRFKLDNSREYVLPF